MISATCWARAAANSSASARPVRSIFGSVSSTRLRMRSPSGVEPGSLVATTSQPRARSTAARRDSRLDLPEPSGPSRVMKTPLRGDVTRASVRSQRGRRVRAARGEAAPGAGERRSVTPSGSVARSRSVRTHRPVGGRAAADRALDHPVAVVSFGHTEPADDTARIRSPRAGRRASGPSDPRSGRDRAPAPVSGLARNPVYPRPMREITNRALDTATARGATYADVRVVRRLEESINSSPAARRGCRRRRVGGLRRPRPRRRRVGLRQLQPTRRRPRPIASPPLAVRIARASATALRQPVVLDDRPPAHGRFETPRRGGPVHRPRRPQARGPARRGRGDATRSPASPSRRPTYHAQREWKSYAATDGSETEQVITHVGAGIEANAVDGDELQRRTYPDAGGG